MSRGGDSDPTIQVPPAQVVALGEADFGEDYYAHHCGRPYRKDEVWCQYFARMADGIVAGLAPARVLDAGCAIGLLVEALRDRGVDAFGIDVSSYAIANVPEAVKPFCHRQSISDELTDWYDLIVCNEVMPHVTPADADAAIANFCRHTNDVLFAVSPFYPPAPRHVNLSPPGHVAEQFAHAGFYRDLAFDASFVAPWAVRYTRRAETIPSLVRQYEQRLSALLSHEPDRQAPVELARAQQRLLQAEDAIHHMERSWFWKARKLWSGMSGR